MKVKISAMESAISDLKTAKQILNNNTLRINEILKFYSDISCVRNYSGQIRLVRDDLETLASRCGSYASALNNIENLYKSYEEQIIDECEGVKAITGAVSAGQQSTIEISSVISDIGFDSTIFDRISTVGPTDFIGQLADMVSALDKVKTLSEYGDYVFDNELLSKISDISKDWGDIEALKKISLIGDCNDLLDAWQKGDVDKVESLLEKYIKKGVKKVEEIKGTVNSTYFNIIWNGTENAVDAYNNFKENPSAATLAAGFLDTMLGAYVDTGTDLTKKAMGLLAGVTGNKFDSDDFGDAMDYFKNMILHPVQTFISGDVDWEYVAKNTVKNVTNAMTDTWISITSFIGGLF